jgi:hypothetical protein
MFYIIYKTTCLVNNKSYIGKHKTKDLNDGYLGSGKYLKRAIQKYGEVNFTKEILYVFDNEHEMNEKEHELVNESYIKDVNNYNLCIGGKGGFSYINNNKLASLANKNTITVKHKKTGEYKKIKKDELSAFPDYEFMYKNTVSAIDENGKKYRVSEEQFKENTNLHGHTKGFTHAINTSTGESEYVLKTDPRFKNGELIGNNKNTIYYNDGEKNYRLKTDDDPKIHKLGLKKGRLFNPIPRKWYNDGTSSFFLTEDDPKEGLFPGRAIKYKNV